MYVLVYTKMMANINICVLFILNSNWEHVCMRKPNFYGKGGNKIFYTIPKRSKTNQYSVPIYVSNEQIDRFGLRLYY